MLRIATRDGERMDLAEGVVQDRLRHFEGKLLFPADAEYESARRVWNGLIDRRPGLIACCRTESDVAAAVGLAREHQLLVSIRGGGHQVAGTAVHDGALVIDLGLMKNIDVDVRGRLVRAQAGVRWGELDRATQAFGLATNGGEVSTTGIAGLTLGGGLGLLQRRFGLSCDNLASVRVITADGQTRVASPVREPDLFWALRGGGRGMGVVTEFEYHLHPIGPEVMVAMAFYPFERAREALFGWREFTAGALEEVTSQILLWTVAPHLAMPEELHGKTVLIALGLYAGPAQLGREALSPLTRLAEPLADLSGAMPYVELQSGMDDLAPAGGRYYWKSLYLDRLGEDALDAMIECARERPSPSTLVVLRHLGGAIARVPEDATAYANRSASYNLSLDAIWSDPHDDARNIAWARRSWDRMSRYSTGGMYVNFPGLAEDVEATLHAAYRGNYQRLAAVQLEYDPNGLFAPAAGARVPALRAATRDGRAAIDPARA